MGTITLKEIDESTDRVFTRVEDNAAGSSLFVALGTGSFGAARKVQFGLVQPKNPATGRIRVTQKITVPFVRVSGAVDVAFASLEYLVPVSLTADERKELFVLHKYLAVSASEASLMKDLVLPS